MILPAYQVGERVIILHNPEEYGCKYEGERGEVKRTYHAKGECLYGVKLDNHTNSRAKSGLYWFTVNGIKLDNEREEIYMFNNFRVATIEFIDNKPTTTVQFYYALYDEEIKEGDTVVVCTGHHGFTLAKIKAISTEEVDKNRVQYNREVVCKVDFTNFDNRRNAVKRATELKREMEKHMREAQEIALYEMLAEKDPTLKTMLDEYKALMDSAK